MIIDEKVAQYINSLEIELPTYLKELEEAALADDVPIIRKDAQSLLRFLITLKRPKRILEVGTAVGFSGSLMSEYMPEGTTLTTIEKFPARVIEAKKNLSRARRHADITLLVGDAIDILKALNNKEEGCFSEIYYAKDKHSIEEFSVQNMDEVQKEALGKLQGQYDFIFMDAAKGQYMNFLPEILQLLSKDGIFITDNVLQEGTIARSKYSIVRRNRTIHMRMREYLYTLTHDDQLDTVVLPVGDGITLSTKK